MQNAMPSKAKLRIRELLDCNGPGLDVMGQLGCDQFHVCDLKVGPKDAVLITCEYGTFAVRLGAEDRLLVQRHGGGRII